MLALGCRNTPTPLDGRFFPLCSRQRDGATISLISLSCSYLESESLLEAINTVDFPIVSCSLDLDLGLYIDRYASGRRDRSVLEAKATNHSPYRHIQQHLLLSDRQY